MKIIYSEEKGRNCKIKDPLVMIGNRDVTDYVSSFTLEKEADAPAKVTITFYPDEVELNGELLGRDSVKSHHRDLSSTYTCENPSERVRQSVNVSRSASAERMRRFYEDAVLARGALGGALGGAMDDERGPDYRGVPEFVRFDPAQERIIDALRGIHALPRQGE